MRGDFVHRATSGPIGGALSGAGVGECQGGHGGGGNWRLV